MSNYVARCDMYGTTVGKGRCSLCGSVHLAVWPDSGYGNTMTLGKGVRDE